VSLTGHDLLWAACGGALALAVLAGVMDWRRTHRRRDLDSIGWAPWLGIQVACFFAALAFAILAWFG
jgi:hypothetical protein